MPTLKEQVVRFRFLPSPQPSSRTELYLDTSLNRVFTLFMLLWIIVFLREESV